MYYRLSPTETEQVDTKLTEVMPSLFTVDFYYAQSNELIIILLNNKRNSTSQASKCTR